MSLRIILESVLVGILFNKGEDLCKTLMIIVQLHILILSFHLFRLLRNFFTKQSVTQSILCNANTCIDFQFIHQIFQNSFVHTAKRL